MDNNMKVSAQLAVYLPIMPLTVPKSTEPWVGVELSPRFCSTSDPWQKTLTNSPRWKTPTSCRCCRSSSVVAALNKDKMMGQKKVKRGMWNITGWREVKGWRRWQKERRDGQMKAQRQILVERKLFQKANNCRGRDIKSTKAFEKVRE